MGMSSPKYKKKKSKTKTSVSQSCLRSFLGVFRSMKNTKLSHKKFMSYFSVFITLILTNASKQSI